MTYFVVICEQGPAWDARRPMREQDGWPEHAGFMDALLDDGFVVLGGPISGATHRARLIVRSASEASVRARLAEDPWTRSGHLGIASVEAWEVLLGREE